MRIALTGATGVVGSALIRALDGQNHAILALSRTPSKLPASANITPLACDLANISPSLDHDIAAFKPEVFIHAGWHGSTGAERNLAPFIESNINASRTLLQMAANAGCRHWIEFGSQAEYSPHLDDPIHEDAPQKPDTAYGSAKIELCHSAQQFCAGHGMHFTWLRLFTCYGREYKPGYIIPYLIETLRGDTLPELRTPHAVWDCLHADDMARAVLQVIAHANPEGVYNLAYGKGVSVGEMAMIIAELVNFPKMDELRQHIASNTTPSQRRVADIRRFSIHFDWTPSTSIQDGLRRCMDTSH